jgi:DNA-binding NtrC family response regulator
MFLQQRFRDVGDQMFHVVYASATSHLLSKAELHAQLEETRRAASEFGIKADIPLLVAHFLGKFTNSLQSVLAISDDALWRLWRLIAYDCPGNVRELENAIECAVALSSGSVLTVDDLASVPDRALAPNAPHRNELVPLAAMVRRAIENTLRETGGSPPHAF